MSNLFDDVTLAGEHGAASRSPSRAARGIPAAGGVVDSEGVGMEEYEGKRKAVVSDLQSLGSAGVNPKV